MSITQLLDRDPVYKKDCALDRLEVGVVPVKWIGTNAILLTDLNMSSGAVYKTEPIIGVTYNNMQLYKSEGFGNGTKIEVYQ